MKIEGNFQFQQASLKKRGSSGNWLRFQIWKQIFVIKHMEAEI